MGKKGTEKRHGEKADGGMSPGDKSRRGKPRRKKANPVLALMCIYFPCLQRSTFPTPLDLDAVDVIWWRVLDACWLELRWC